MNPWDALQKFRSKKNRWLFGYLGYDLKNYIEDLETENLPLTDTPDMYFMEPEILLKIESGYTELLGAEVQLDKPVKSVLPGAVGLDLEPLIGKEEYLGTSQF